VIDKNVINQPLLLQFLISLCESGTITLACFEKAIADVNVAEFIYRHELMHWAKEDGITLQ
jgi:hypothetical protein